MPRNKVDRIGEERCNNFGSKMIIIRSNGCEDIDVYFPEYNWTAINRQYTNFKKGGIKCPYEPRVYNHGYIGDGKYEISKNGRETKYYDTWHHMLQRCYDVNYHKKKPTYKNCIVEPYLLNFQNAAEFFDSIYYEVPGERMCLDKDILVHGNKLYSRETCIFVPEKINILFTKRDKLRGEYPLGVHKYRNKFIAQCSDDERGCQIYLGIYNNPEEAFNAYKSYKENLIKQFADKYYNEKMIPKEVYEALYKYEVQIND